MKVLLEAIALRSQKTFNYLLPATCLLCGCGLRGELLCSGCELDLPHLGQAGTLCAQCSLPLTGAGPYCGHCLHRPPAFNYSVIPFSYEHPLDFLIHGFKYRGRLAYGRALAQALANHIYHHYLDREQPLPDVIVPVPLHWTRRWRRGFNQADVIGQLLADKLQLPIRTRLCQRRLRTPSQKGLTRAERQKNLRRAFTLTIEAAELEGKCVALLDDVVTTTATARELSELLLKGGAREVHVWALARTLEKKS